MSQLKILIVEDDPLYATEIEMLLFKLGYDKVEVCSDSEEAMRKVEMLKPDLIIMDILIEGELNGVEVAEKIEDKKIPILFITSVKESKIYERAKQVGYVGYLVKPFDEFMLQSATEYAIKTVGGVSEKQTKFEEWTEDEVIQDFIFIKKQTFLQKIAIEEIMYVQSNGNYCFLFSAKEKHIINLSMVKLIQRLSSDLFIRIHKSYLINIKFIEGVSLGSTEIIKNSNMTSSLT
jgi:DNA-binding LytR/AlgR family response regulator